MDASGLWKHAYPYFKQCIEIDNLSPDFVSREEKAEDNAKHLKIMNLIVDYLKESVDESKFTVEIACDEGKTPFLFIDINRENSTKTVGFYAHVDKQPPLTEKWTNGREPYKLTEEDGKYYGRGTADDCYAPFIIINIIKTLLEQGDMKRYMLLIEASEESGSADIKHYLEKFSDRLEKMDYLFVCDSGGEDDTIYFTSSLRGCFTASLKLKVAPKPYHSGVAGGCVPTPLFQLFSTLQSIVDPTTEESKVFKVDMPSHIEEQYRNLVKFGKADILSFETLKSSLPAESEFHKLKKNVWDTSIVVTGIDGLPTTDKASNLIAPEIKIKLSIRIPPTYDEERAKRELGEYLQGNEFCEVEYTPDQSCPGWISGDAGREFNDALLNASNKVYNTEPQFVPIGASIPVMGLLQSGLKNCKIFATGVNGSDCNSHSFDENLDIEKMHKFTECMYLLLNDL